MKGKWIGLFTIICILSYIVSIAFLGIVNDNYNHTQNLVSELGKPNMNYNFVLNVTLIISGISLIFLAYYLKEILPKSITRDLGTIALGLFGLSVVFGGVFPCEVNCMNPTTTSGYLHAYLGMPTIITAPLSFIGLSRSMKNSLQLRGISNAALWLGILTIIASLASFTLFLKLDLVGLGQRITAFFQLSVPFLIAIKIIKPHEHVSD